MSIPHLIMSASTVVQLVMLKLDSDDAREIGNLRTTFEHALVNEPDSDRIAEGSPG